MIIINAEGRTIRLSAEFDQRLDYLERRYYNESPKDVLESIWNE